MSAKTIVVIVVGAVVVAVATVACMKLLGFEGSTVVAGGAAGGVAGALGSGFASRTKSAPRN